MQIFYGKRKTLQKVFLILLTLVLIGIATIMLSNEEVAEVSSVPAVAYYEKVVALTFDDGPGYKTTMTLLEGLKERDVRATFFLLGDKIEERKEVVERMKEDGHLIGNHTYSHVQLDSVNIACASDEIEKTNIIIQEITGETPTFIRPPYGSWNTTLENEIDMTPVLWTIDTSDWNTRDVNKIVEHVVSEVESGDIILMHDIYDTSVVAALEIVDQLKRRGYVFVTVDELLIE